MELFRLTGARLQQNNSLTFVRHFVKMITLLAAKHGGSAVVQALEALGPGYVMRVCALAAYILSGLCPLLVLLLFMQNVCYYF